MRLHECKNVYVSGSLVFCRSCRRVIGFDVMYGNCILRDVRLLYFVPMDFMINFDKFIMLTRISDHGPMKRKQLMSDLSVEPPSKKSKFDNTQSVIVYRMRVQDEAPLFSSLDLESDPPVIVDIVYDSEDDDEIPTELDYYDDDYELESYDSDSNEEFIYHRADRLSTPYSFNSVQSLPNLSPVSIDFQPYEDELSEHENFRVLGDSIVICEFFSSKNLIVFLYKNDII